jgi:nucleotide-binding universal stress UspA family protein
MFKKILVPLNGFRLSEGALPYAQNLAQCYQAKLFLLHIMQPVYNPTFYVTANHVLRDANFEALKYAHGKVENTTNRIRDEGVLVVSDICRGFSHVEILKYVDRNKIDLIVMTAKACHAITRRLFGNVTGKVLQTSSVPCLIVPDTKD